ncbi:hypothetical protein B0T26DRAFT_674209 [Lasiosphaeria miniovina]|uniref:Uncharacterized protein n=1 Tax=Lasiosphaeria miniovina TaxID=1954250 RepID=A0AA40AV01_9PEZI|nr:uncharacterized protein B0T26DRAFT_674209 [Lasiosphaeria miniovina]KAK0722522.1 hypothetical protein B0T26DRAFT_674209 [Lasiosphaeria miniovina]
MPAAAMLKEDDNVAWHTLRVVPVLVEPTRGLCDDLKVDLLVAAAKDFRRLRDITALEKPWNHGDTEQVNNARPEQRRLRLAIAAKMCKCERLELEVELTVEVVKEALVIETRSRKALEEIFLRSAIVPETACFKRAQSVRLLLQNGFDRLMLKKDDKLLAAEVFGMSGYVGGRRAHSIEDVRLVEGSGISTLLKTKLSRFCSELILHLRCKYACGQ